VNGATKVQNSCPWGARQRRGNLLAAARHPKFFHPSDLHPVWGFEWFLASFEPSFPVFGTAPDPVPFDPTKNYSRKIGGSTHYAVPPSADFLNATICRARCARGMFRLFWRVLIEGGRVRLPPAAGWKKKRKKSQNFDLWLPQVQKTKKKGCKSSRAGFPSPSISCALATARQTAKLKKKLARNQSKTSFRGPVFRAARGSATHVPLSSSRHTAMHCKILERTATRCNSSQLHVPPLASLHSAIRVKRRRRISFLTCKTLCVSLFLQASSARLSSSTRPSLRRMKIPRSVVLDPFCCSKLHSQSSLIFFCPNILVGLNFFLCLNLQSECCLFSGNVGVLISVIT